MIAVEVFQEKQKKLIGLLEKTLKFLETGKQFGVKIDDSFIEKVKKGIATTENEQLKVALIGGFSEGKTSIAAAWAEDYDQSKMKISQAESSNEIQEFTIGDIRLIDTPGLFGFKENNDGEKYKDITKKYVSEAHLILYVMNPNNPIKESHQEELCWLFKELGLLDRTIFVIGRFDEEVDIDDEDEYTRGLAIKRENIKNRLKDLKIIGDNDQIDIIGVSANPFNKGIDFWLPRLEEFRRLSHIEKLQQATAKKIAESSSKQNLILASQKSIISHVLLSELPQANERVELAVKECKQLEELGNDMQEELFNTKDKINNVRINLRDFILNYFTDLILQAKGTNLETFEEFFESNIGSEGIIIETKIRNEFERQLGVGFGELKRIQESYNAAITHYENVLGKMAFEGIKKGGAVLKNGLLKIDPKMILAGRDLLKVPVKFKPWGAIKLAKGANKALPLIGECVGIAIDLWELYSEGEKQKKFQIVVNDIASKLSDQRKEYIDFLNNEKEFIDSFFASYLDLKERVEMIREEVSYRMQQKQELSSWQESGEAIEVEFEELN